MNYVLNQSEMKWNRFFRLRQSTISLILNFSNSSLTCASDLQQNQHAWSFFADWHNSSRSYRRFLNAKFFEHFKWLIEFFACRSYESWFAWKFNWCTWPSQCAHLKKKISLNWSVCFPKFKNIDSAILKQIVKQIICCDLRSPISFFTKASSFRVVSHGIDTQAEYLFW